MRTISSRSADDSVARRSRSPRHATVRLGAAIPALAALRGSHSRVLRGASRGRAAPRAGVLPADAPANEWTRALTPGQRAVLLQQQFAPTRPILNEPVVLELHGTIDTESLLAALRVTLSSHPGLARASPRWRRIRRQEHASEVAIPVDLVETDDDAGVDAALLDVACRSFDLASGPLARAAVVKRSRRHHVLILVAHHLVHRRMVGRLAPRGARRALARRALEPTSRPRAVRARDPLARAGRLRRRPRIREFWRNELEGASFAFGMDLPPEKREHGRSRCRRLRRRRSSTSVRPHSFADPRSEPVPPSSKADSPLLPRCSSTQAHRPDVVVAHHPRRSGSPRPRGHRRLHARRPARADPASTRTRRLATSSRAHAQLRARSSAHRSLGLGEAVAARRSLTRHRRARQERDPLHSA